ncbi:hypothetical protein SASPL_122482 [Salvia splendens]|uniref:Protein kinase domain-containing protein n=1 Tax=Salvia splendens TaxID=180675 RepID=A0A8X8XIF4_SALSN|nr:probable serine/threonine-protein kinase PBL5 [Salvia splendens]KAG6415080.1 hypothetical protein SASPL_122482 [Salvia splendens]
MGCFSCARSSHKKQYKKKKLAIDDRTPSDHSKASLYRSIKDPKLVSQSSNGSLSPSSDAGSNIFEARNFALADLVAATENFKDGNFLGEGGFGPVYKGRLPNGEIVAIKQLDRNGSQGIREFVAEVLTLSNAEHSNLVKLIGYCAEGDQRLLVYEYMPLGCLQDLLHDIYPGSEVLDWNSRMKIAAGAAEGLEYLHTKMSPPIIYRDLKCSNILLGKGYNSKLSDFGLAKEGPSGDKTHVSTRVMGTYGYCAPDYAMTGQLNFKSDIYSFGVVLLEILTGRRAVDYTKSGPEQNLVDWARPLFKDRKRFHEMADPALEGHYPVRGLYQALAIAAMCIQEQPNIRPNIGDIVKALKYLASQHYDQHNSSPYTRRNKYEHKAEIITKSEDE